jgi:uncharacterized protein DUF6582
MARVIAHVSGIALTPGMSRNRRVYTRGAIARMVGRAQERIEAGNNLNIVDRSKPAAVPEPLTQLTHHETTDSTRIVGRITGLSLDEHGQARFNADIADTPHGRVIASLLDTSDGRPPFLRNVSIRGSWLGEIKQVLGEDGEPAMTAPDIDLDGLDYVDSPGVPGAGVDSFQWAVGVPRPGEADSSRTLIHESVTEVRVTSLTEETAPAPAPATPRGGDTPPAASGLREALRVLAPATAHVLDNGACVTCAAVGEAAKDPDKPYGDVTYADPGYQKDGTKRYPLDSAAHARAAWSYINQAKNTAFYTAAQLKRVKGRIVRALKSFGVKVSSEGWTIEPAYQVTESLAKAIAEYYGDDPARAGSWCVTASNGPVTINMSSYCMDPADLDVILRAAADASCKALAQLDPDMDGDVDVPGAGPNSNNMTPGEAAPRTAGEGSLEGLAAPAPAAETEPDPVTEAAPVAPVDPAPEPETETEENADTEEEPAVSEPTAQETAAAQAPAATETAPAPAAAATAAAAPSANPAAPAGITLTTEQFNAMLDRIAPAAPAPAPAAAPVAAAPAQPASPAEAAPAATATETAPAAPAAAVQESEEQETARLVSEGVAAALRAEGYQVPGVTETKDQMIARLVAEQVTVMKQQLVASGAVPVQRAGLEPGGEVNEHRQPAVVTGAGGAEGLNSHGLPLSWPDKPLHQYTSEELSQYTGPVLDHHVMGRKAVTDLP